MIERYILDGLTYIRLKNHLLEVVILPRIGGKIISLKSIKSGIEYLLPNQSPTGKYRNSAFGDDYSLFDVSGYDDCFPNIKAGELLFAGQVYTLHDHGEWWGKPWDIEIESDSLILNYTDQHNRYNACRRLVLTDNRLEIHYQVKNLTRETIPFIWAAHPLLSIEEGDRILFPPRMSEAIVYWASDEKRFGIGKRISMPVHGGLNLAEVQPKSSGWACKLFGYGANAGKTSLLKANLKEQLTIAYDINKFPWLGIWLCYGGWPVDGRPGHYTIALEPTNAPSDHLPDVAHNKSNRLLPFRTLQWNINLSCQALDS